MVESFRIASVRDGNLPGRAVVALRVHACSFAATCGVFFVAPSVARRLLHCRTRVAVPAALCGIAFRTYIQAF